ncbi:hypothetical protein [Candidatus Nitrosocosmicus hydrocola]|uniref:hypothetical protein n=1 Tax=Candidatus Nitrosocosmicus hydrocola TaxID=1826872 RepID=UPI0011E5A836|nr:hypothetical protein [Candidatus Nitrosocosmicus hydrocola]
MRIMSINENWILSFGSHELKEEEGSSYYLFRFTKIITLSILLRQIYDLFINGNITPIRIKILHKRIGDKHWSFVSYSDKDYIKLWKDRMSNRH